MKPEIIARRRTADNIGIALWSDGSLTYWNGRAIKGSAHPRTDEQRRQALAAGWNVIGNVELYDADELPRFIAAARKAPGAMPGAVRAEFARAARKEKQLTPSWTVYETDRDGKPTIRVWKLPRLLYGGLAVFDYCGKRNSSGGRYVLMRELGRGGRKHAPGTVEATGFRFNDLGALSEHLRRERDQYLKAEYR
jgi:hypothetical protein